MEATGVSVPLFTIYFYFFELFFNLTDAPYYVSRTESIPSFFILLCNIHISIVILAYCASSLPIREKECLPRPPSMTRKTKQVGYRVPFMVV